ncbi:exosortase O [Candidatus Synechococcus calcipolaris G9]|uniref:Exosortase O n=1 Tax=Candidatus Synechococcus calcipolaris G9 TaxID=1497997 RepID=A0ABT6F1G5_9SYNE|nr:exosortase O [Candidatus Synechococcus calcipolaris]MDG2991679.1 exosortase O [Candidatus Synechococcus calcipolaris G9]
MSPLSSRSQPLGLSRVGWIFHLALVLILTLSWLHVTQGAWMWLLGRVAAGWPSPLGILILGSVLGGVIYGVRFLGWRFRLVALAPRPLPFLFMVGMAIATVVEPYLLALPQLAAVFWLMSAYGFLGLVISKERWQRGLSFGILAAVILPFSLDMNVGLGFPLRLWTANTVAHLFSQLGGTVITSQDIVVLENTFAQVDLPCSGLKGLGVGFIFFLLITCVERCSMGIGWLLVCLTQGLLLIVANVGRVAILVFLGAIHQERLAAILHVPLGVIGFITCLLVTWVLLRCLPKIELKTVPKTDRYPAPRTEKDGRSPLGISPWPLGMATLVFLVLMGLPPASLGTTGLADLHHLPWPASLERQVLALSPLEETFFAQIPGTIVTKEAFAQGDISGTFLVVGSSSWRSHHAPEQCFQGNGFQLTSLTETTLGPNLPVHWLTLNGGAQTAAYWFQSPQRITPHYLDRFWASLGRSPANSWLMVSILFDPGYPATDPQIQDLAQTIQETLQSAWQESSHG